MPVNGPTGASAVTPVSGGGSARALSCAAFKNDPTLAKLAAGGVRPLARGSAGGGAVKTVQAALFSLGFIQGRGSIDGIFGSGTEAAVKAFQAKAGLAQSGKVDANTLAALDRAAAKQIATLKARTPADGSKREAYRVVADISNPAKTRLYVLGKNDEIKARYLTSPGSSAFPTQGSHFKVQDVLPRQPWNPPNSSWAARAKQVPPGIDNPMGILKLSLGAYSEYIHGIPPGEEAALGRAASHGCLRMSGSNVLELGEKFAEAGTDVTINRDAALSARLAKAYDASGLEDRPTDAGREYLFGYMSGELGKRSHIPPGV